ncbi:hypothetical protein CKA32_003271 [Geitlerinema sp. FC II]|nr:hypothetical protein CKA32_003670 [Geitlerinema sp. FC II]PPT07751.1 hypothetical protein CKA32_003271 [Geitlerinema sp. FC II]
MCTLYKIQHQAVETGRISDDPTLCAQGLISLLTPNVLM